MAEERCEPEVLHPEVAPRPRRILIAEDDYEMRRLLVAALRRDGYEVTEADNGLRLLSQLYSPLHYGIRADVDLIISDIRMPGVDGLEVLSGLQSYDGAPPVILITAFGDRQVHAEANRLGAVALFDKPFDLDDLRTFVRRLVPPRNGAPDPLTGAA
jgi:CheY-like chemotaxis protein